MNRKTLVKYFFSFFLITGCIFQKTKPSHSNHWLKIALPNKISPSDWNQCQNNACLQYASLVMEGLFKWTQIENSIQFTPALCESWQIEEPSTLKLQLRKSVRWTNGESLTAQDVIQTWKRILSSKNFQLASPLFPVLNAKAFYHLQLPFEKVGLSAPDAHTLIVKLDPKQNTPHKEFLFSLGSPLLFPTYNGKANFTITLGKFKSLPNLKSETGIFVKNDQYYGQSPQIDGVEILAIANPQVRSQLFLDKEVEFVDELPKEFWESPHFVPKLSLAPAPRSFILVFNPYKKPFHQVAIRESFTQAIDRSEFKETLHLPVILSSNLSPAIRNETPPSWFPKFNPAIGTTLMGESKSADPQRIVLSYVQGAITEQIALNLQAQWASNLRQRVEIVPITSERILNLESSASSMYILPSTANSLLKTQLPIKSAEFNRPKFPAFVESPLIALPLIDASELTSLSERMISQEHLVFPLYQESTIGFKSERVLKMEQDALGMWDLGSVELKG